MDRVLWVHNVFGDTVDLNGEVIQTAYNAKRLGTRIMKTITSVSITRQLLAMILSQSSFITRFRPTRTAR